MKKFKIKKLTSIELTRRQNQDLAHELFLASLKTKATVYKARKGKGSYSRKEKHKTF